MLTLLFSHIRHTISSPAAADIAFDVSIIAAAHFAAAFCFFDFSAAADVFFAMPLRLSRYCFTLRCFLRRY